MANLKETTADGLQTERPASEPYDVIRKQEHDSDLSARPTHAEVAESIGTAGHSPVTKADTYSVGISLTGQYISAIVFLDPAGGLKITPTGLAANFGTGATSIAPGNHTHANDHAPAASGVTDTATSVVSLTGGYQVIFVNVTLDPAGGLTATPSGIAATGFATTSHTHPDATGTGAGFISAASQTKLDGSNPNARNVVFLNSNTLTWADNGTGVTGSVRVGSGLTANTGGLAVDFTQVASRSYVDDQISGISGATGSSDYADPDNLFLKDEFIGGGELPWTVQNFSGTAATGSAAGAVDTGGGFHFGILMLTTPTGGTGGTGATGSKGGMVLLKDGVLPVISLDGLDWHLRAVFKLSSVTRVDFRLGFFKPTSYPASGDEIGIFVRYNNNPILNPDGGTGKFRFNAIATSSGTTTPSTITADTKWHHLSIRCVAGALKFSIDGETEITIGSTPPEGMFPAFSLLTNDANAKIGYLDFISFVASELARASGE